MLKTRNADETELVRFTIMYRHANQPSGVASEVVVFADSLLLSRVWVPVCGPCGRWRRTSGASNNPLLDPRKCLLLPF